MNVSIEKEIVKDLITFKLQHTQELISSIIDRWNINNADDFIIMARNGELENAEMDAITMRQLMLDYNKLDDLLHDITSREEE